jgi:hypothetical protein
VKNKLDKEKFLSAPWTSWGIYILEFLKWILMPVFKNGLSGKTDQRGTSRRKLTPLGR